MAREKLNREPCTTVCLVDYNPLAAHRLHQILAHDPSLQLFSHDDVLSSRMTAKNPLQVFVLDRATLPTALSKYIRSLRLRFPDAKTLVLDNPLPTLELCRLLFLGIKGFLAYSDVEEHLPAAIRTVADGHLWIAPNVLEQYVRFSAHLSPLHGKKSLLTRREQRILELVQRRLSNKEIASILNISEHTVKFHLGNVFTKLGVRDRQGVRKVARSRYLHTLLFQKAK